ncbi:regulator [Nocardiopsis sp. NRRL B-16309]|nr:regulator [Nocardiopsis sp. NRRL B-16309]
MSHMCGLCLALRDDHGQASRVATNYDGLVVSVLTAAQSEACAGTRTAGRCPLRGMRGAEVADGSGAHLAASVSLLLASAKITDHIEDGDGLYGRRGVRALAGRVAERWRRGAQESGAGLGFDGAALVAVVDRQREAELAAGPGTDLLAVTRPTEEATGEAFAHTAVLAARPANTAPLREAGRLFGRVAHLLDAVEDREEDAARGAWNPITATGTELRRVRALCDDAILGVGLALREVEFDDDRLVRALLERELRRAVERAFAHGGHPGHGHPGQGQLGQGHPGHGYPGQGHPGHGHPGQGQPGHGHPGHGHPGQGHPGHGYPGQGQPGHVYPGQGHQGYGHHGEPPHQRNRRRRDDGIDSGSHYEGYEGPGGGGEGSGGGRDGDRCCGSCSCQTPRQEFPARRRGVFSGCAVALFMCCTCQFCCRDPHPGPWTGKPRSSWCDCCECCSCCDDCTCCCD